MANVEEARTRIVGARNLFSISELYHENSKIIPSLPKIAQSDEAILVTPGGFKTYQYSEHIELARMDDSNQAEILSAITDRRSCREYSEKAVPLNVLSRLLHYSFGLAKDGYRRCTPSAGGLYPLEPYVMSLNVEGLAKGIYHYNVRGHSLNTVKEGDLRARLAETIFVEEAVRTAAIMIAITGMFSRSKIKYGERAYRFVLLEAGHAIQNVCLSAAVSGLATCPVGGFVDDYLNDLLDVDGVEEAAVYAVTIGHPYSDAE